MSANLITKKVNSSFIAGTFCYIVLNGFRSLTPLRADNDIALNNMSETPTSVLTITLLADIALM